jgi:aryl-alcohol dehydrogenase-like predicted oxidoreductase
MQNRLKKSKNKRMENGWMMDVLCDDGSMWMDDNRRRPDGKYDDDASQQFFFFFYLLHLSNKPYLVLNYIWKGRTMRMSSSSLPRIGLGMAALGRPGYINLDRAAVFGSDGRTLETMQDQANVVLDQLFQSSPDTPWIDCARSYGLSEKFTGEYLRKNKVDPKAVYVSSKWGYTYVADWNVKLADGQPHEVKDHSKKNFLKQLEETNQEIGEFLNLYQIHSATVESGILENTECHEALHKCREERGWALGLSVSSPLQGDVLAAAMKIEVEGRRLFDSVQCTYNLLEQKPGAALQKAHEAGIDIIIKEGLANGRILRHPKVIEYSEKLGCSTDQLALACILSQPFEPRVLSGAVTAEQLTSNLGAIEVAKKLKEDKPLLKEIMESCVMDSEQYWKDRSALAWN